MALPEFVKPLKGIDYVLTKSDWDFLFKGLLGEEEEEEG